MDHELLLCAVILLGGLAVGLLVLQLGYSRYCWNQEVRRFAAACMTIRMRQVIREQSFLRLKLPPDSPWVNLSEPTTKETDR